jgi:hypothetical protein
MTIEQALCSKNFCNICTTTMLSTTRIHIGICAGCDKNKPPRMEHIVRDKIESHIKIQPTMRDNKFIGGEACASDRTRPDLCWVLEDRIIHVEIDEHSHEDREVSCELKKLDSANWGLSDFGLKHLPTWTIRFNCSEYDGRRISLDARCNALVHVINRLLERPLTVWDPLRLNVSYMFYHSKSQKHIEAAKESKMSIVVQDE